MCHSIHPCRGAGVALRVHCHLLGRQCAFLRFCCSRLFLFLLKRARSRTQIPRPPAPVHAILWSHPGPAHNVSPGGLPGAMQATGSKGRGPGHGAGRHVWALGGWDFRLFFTQNEASGHFFAPLPAQTTHPRPSSFVPNPAADQPIHADDDNQDPSGRR